MTSRHPIPDAALAQHVAILGKTGSGKTSTEKLAVEQVVAQGFRVCVLDTIKSDWWGITSSADGKRAGLPFKILGGPRGHVPLHSSAGKAIGQLVGSGKLPLSIIDMADFEAGGLQRFFVDFAPALLRSARGVVYLVIEEAHELAPKERAGFGAESMAIHWAKKLATAGRSKGIRLIVATQRVQALHNAVLGSCETMIAHRLSAPADQEPVVKWLKANAEKEMVAKVQGSLASLPTGTAWICSGEAKIFEMVAFQKFKTYDNTKTPTGDSAEIAIKTAPVDQDELRAVIGDAVKEAEANDPKTLKAEIAKLKAEVAKKPATVTQSDPKEIKAAERRGFAYGETFGIKKGFEFANLKLQTLHNAVIASHEVSVKTAYDAAAMLKSMSDEADAANKDFQSGSTPAQGARPAVAHTPTAERSPLRPAPRTSSPESSGDGTLTGPQRKLLQTLAWWARMGHSSPTRAQAAAVCGWSPGGSNIRDRISELSRLTLVTRPTQDTITLTDAGAAVAPEPDMNANLKDGLRAVLTTPQLKLFNELDRLGGDTDRDTLSGLLGWEPGGSNIRDRISELRRLQIVTTAGESVVFQSWVQ